MNIEITRAEASLVLNAIEMYSMRLSDDIVWSGDPDAEEEMRDLEILAGIIRDLLTTNDDNPTSY